MTDLEIRPLVPGDADAVDLLLTSDSPRYRQHFEAFPGGRAEIETALAQADNDAFSGLFVDGELGALVMLRGLDAGFIAPAFGVYVAERHAGRGLGTLALAFAETWCKLDGRAEMMLTVHPEHAAARRLYEDQGFTASGEHSEIGHVVYRKRLRLR